LDLHGSRVFYENPREHCVKGWKFLKEMSKKSLISLLYRMLSGQSK
jgi:hypothetical protein